MRRHCISLIALACTLAATRISAADSRADFLKLIDRPAVPPDVRIESAPASNHIAEFHFSYAAEAGQRVPGFLLEPDMTTNRRPAVIALHGTGGRKESMLPLLRRLAARGFVAVAIDGPHHGERARSGKGSADYDEAIFNAWKHPGEHPFYFDTVWDVMRLVDYLDTRDDVDPKRIGLIGISKGGIETYLTAAVDPRITAAVPCIGVQSFRWELDHNDWQARIGTIQPAFDEAAREAGVGAPDSAFVQRFYDRVSPGIYGEFDGPAMLPLIAPRPLLTINGDSDARNPLPGLAECTNAVHAAYRAAGADDCFRVIIEPHTAHKVTPESETAAIEWFVQWLKP
jgi:dienelactone hydrolase